MISAATHNDICLYVRLHQGGGVVPTEFFVQAYRKTFGVQIDCL